MKRLFVLMAPLLLMGCASAIDYTIAKTARQDCQWMRILADEPICNTYLEPQPPPPATELYCYRTLARVNCYTEPIVGRKTLTSG